jgi:hypothetical protein
MSQEKARLLEAGSHEVLRVGRKGRVPHAAENAFTLTHKRMFESSGDRQMTVFSAESLACENVLAGRVVAPHTAMLP